ncbi:hypothetical protein NQ314_001304 [Rhamnusium bicolor]|uniref:non-specific serine/threonine protein kinase n=1 Tax=Rhamnusium bicolor TaxID=1586634 RepID=A0AAV8ZVM2_9CUCU|nr:hypothetical protein NQ314_001304 [Rhamnusium bicolor]
MSLEDYEVLSIIGNNINSTTYKVRHKETKKIFIWQTVKFDKTGNTNVEFLREQVKKRQDIGHPNILKFYDLIEQKEVLYIMIEYCEHGSLRNIIESCLVNRTYISEELVCKILYQIAFTIKTIDSYAGKLTANEIFLDEDYNVKLFNFQINYKNKSMKELKMGYLGLVLYEVCTFTKFDKSCYEYDIKKVSDVFSNNLLSLIISMIKDGTDLKKNVNKVLCHPTVLLKSSQWCKDKSFSKIASRPTQNEIQDKFTDYTSKLEKLRNKEIALQVREQQLNEKEHKLSTRERKIAVMERIAREKLQQAELYLKRCREFKPSNSGSIKSTGPSQGEEKLSYENLDSTYVSCGDSILLPTSKKLNVNKIIKPAPFTRTLSERRIRFKGHSPLKEVDFNKRKSVRLPKLQKRKCNKKNSEWLTCSEETDKSSIEGSIMGICKKSKQLFPARNMYENENLKSDDQCKPITWTEENKKYAFELLRVLNSDKENQCVQHTYL